VHRIDDHARIVDAERDHRAASVVGVHVAQFAAGPEHDLLIADRPGHLGIHAGHRPGFLHVAIERAVHDTLDAAGQILDPQFGNVVIAPYECDPFAVAAWRGAYRSTDAGDNAGHLARI
jgi:hypothetical protein